MTAPLLLAWICAGLVLQLAVAVGVALWARRRAGPTTPEAGVTPAGSGTAWAGWRELRVVRREAEDRAGTQCSFHLAPVDGEPLPPFLPGQFLTFALKVPDDAGEARTLTRCYSLSDRPGPDGYRVTIKRVPAPADRPNVPAGAASGHLHDHVREGDVLQVKAPGGRFYLEPDPAVPAVFLGGGIGITPLLSMVRWALDEEPERELHLFYGVRDGDAHAFKRVLEELAAQHPRLHLHVLYSHPGPDDVEGRDFQHRGHLDVALVRRFVPDGRNAFYVCGPPPMMASLLPALRAWGVAPSDLHYEAFGPASGLAAEGTTHASEPAGMERVAITFRRSGRTLAWTGQDANLLDLAERNDLVVESGCRSGSCGGCETKLVSGTVGYARAPDHEVAPGCCLLCVGTPESALVLEA